MQSLGVLKLPEWKGRFPGVLSALTIAIAATFLSEHYGGPQFLYALLFGMAFNYIPPDGITGPGIDFAARAVLRFGVALLGARITLGQISGLGGFAVLMVIGGVIATILFGTWLGRLLGRSSTEGLLTGGSVAICGASAALAISAVLPKDEASQRLTLLTVVGVTTLSTLSMVIYPAIAKALGLDPIGAGIFLGGTIHDVAQVVGAGFMISPEAGDTATVVKLVRVAMLVPVVLVLFVVFRRSSRDSSGARPPVLPGFLVGFVVLVGVNSLGLIPAKVSEGLSDISRWCLATAIAALGVKTSLKQLAEVGWRPVALMVGETVFLALLIIGGLLVMR